ncbi:cysteine hydrolase family protein [Stackebrandtia nassauensis]|nr:isochorismatase family protein [Stackebrandtia nassauensis]
MTNKALIVIDVQESFRQRPNWVASSNPDIVGSVNRLVDHARSRGDKVVWMLHTEPGSGNVFDPALGHVRLMDGLEPADGEPVLPKTSVNSFTTTSLAQLLTTWGVSELTICGIRTDQCCETTTRIAADLGYQVTFVTDATATTPIPHPDAYEWDIDDVLADPRTLSTKDIIDRVERTLAGRGFATVSTIDEVTAR